MTSKIVEQHTKCPVCPSSDGYCVYEDGHGHCYACNYHKHIREEFDPLSEEFTYEYIAHRGLTKETLKFYDIKTKINSEGKPVSVGFPYYGNIYKVRSLEEKKFYWSPDGSNSAKAGLFGREKFSAGSHKYVTITEGEYDASSLYQCLRSPVVSVQSSSTAARDCAVDHTFLNSFERIYICFDNDAAGREAVRGVAKLFDYNKVYLVRLTKYKDANDYLQHGAEDDLRNVWNNAKRYLPESIISSFQEFEEILKEKPKPSIPYPFKTLNEMTFGNRTGETVLLTAQEGIGKTEIMHAFEFAFLKGQPDDPLAAIFLEEPKRRHLQALAGLELRQPVHLPSTNVSEDSILAALKRVVSKDDLLHVYSHFGSSDPDVLLDTIRFCVSARGCRRVMLDHITMAVSGLAGEDERRALDYLSTRLEMMVKELDFALILVSHVNDFGQTRGSRNISKVADIRIDLKRDVTDPDPNTRNLTSLTVSKNRFSGRTGPAGVLRFDPITYTLEEEFDGPQAANDNRATELVARQSA